METQITPIQLVLAVPSLVCLVIVIMNMFQNGHTGLGITSAVLTFVCGIGSLIAFVWGWMNGNVSTKVMIVWTLLTVASVIVGALGV